MYRPQGRSSPGDRASVKCGRMFKPWRAPGAGEQRQSSAQSPEARGENGGRRVKPWRIAGAGEQRQSLAQSPGGRGARCGRQFKPWCATGAGE